MTARQSRCWCSPKCLPTRITPKTAAARLPLDHLIGAQVEQGRDFEAERLGGLGVAENSHEFASSHLESPTISAIKFLHLASEAQPARFGPRHSAVRFARSSARFASVS